MGSFEAAEQLRSFTAAAEALGVSQPAVEARRVVPGRGFTPA